MKKILLPFLLLFLLITNSEAQSLRDTLEQKLIALSKKANLPGFGVAIINQEEILYEKGFGYADVASQSPYTTESVHNIGSVSKTFIGVAIMQLVEQGKLSLDTKINDLLPFPVVHPKYPNTPLTVRQLATHTTGIKDTRAYNFKCYVLEEDYASIKGNLSGKPKLEVLVMKKNKKQALGSFLKDYLQKKGKLYKRKNFNKHQPGTHYNYTNIGAALAAYVVEVAAGQSYGDYVKENILQPLKMKDSGWTYDDIDPAKLATTYHPKGQAYPKYSLVTYPDGGMRTSVHDLSLYVQEILLGHDKKSDFLEVSSFDAMLQEQFKGESDTEGIFWSINRKGRIGHNGADPGILTTILLFPEEKVSFVFMTNCSAHEDKDKLKNTVAIWRVLREYALKMQAAE